LNILFVTNTMEVGGIEKTLTILGPELAARGHGVTVLSSGGVLERELHEAGIRHVKRPVSLRKPAALLSTALWLRDTLLQAQFDVVHSLSAAGNLAAAFGRQSAPPALFVSSPMGLENAEREQPWRTRLRNRLLTWRADWVLVISPAIRKALLDAGVPAARLVECSLTGVQMQRFHVTAETAAAVRRELGVSEDELLVSTIGALHPRKSHHLFIAAARQVLDRVPNARFAVIGGGPLRAQLLAQARELGLDGKLTFPGERLDVPEILAATDVYVKPGIVEGFSGLTPLEAMASHVPVVAFDTTDVRAAITDGESGLIVPDHDPASLAEAVVRLLQTPSLRYQLAEQGFNVVRDRCSMTQVAAELEAAYRECLRRAGGRSRPLAA
jgi:glycosyltransferase involved in cell wall biosynthesis